MAAGERTPLDAEEIAVRPRAEVGPADARVAAVAPRLRRRADQRLLLAGFGAFFVAAYVVTYWLRMPDWKVPAFFMPSGVLLAALLVVSRRRWWTYLLVAVAGCVLVHLFDRHAGIDGILVLPFYLAGAVMAATGIRRYGGVPLLRSTRSMTAYLFFGLLLLPAVSLAAILGVGYSSGRMSDPIWCLAHYGPAHMLGTFVTALVALEEDPYVRIATYVVDADPATLRADMSVVAEFRPLTFPTVPDRAVIVPMFRPAPAS